MNRINRNNYETFFLLYTDNELSVEERNAVHEFLLANPDLEEELVMLQQSILKPDPVFFEDKKRLIKKEIYPNSLQEELLLFLDNELITSKKSDIERLIKEDATVKKEWEILLQTKVTPNEPIVFPDKPSLYRKETVSVVNFTWQQVAVAALLIGFGIWGTLIYFNHPTPTGSLTTVKHTAPTTVPGKNVGKQQFLPKTTIPAIILPKEKEQDQVALRGIIKKLPKEKINPALKKVNSPLMPNMEKANIVVGKNNNDLPAPGLDNINNNGRNKTITDYVQQGKQGNDRIANGNNDIIDAGLKQDPTISFVAASYNEITEENNNRILFMDEEKIKKTKLGGIFRKVKRVLERNANLKPGSNHIKVANLEFAIQ